MSKEGFQEGKEVGEVKNKHIVLEIGTEDFPIISTSRERIEALKEDGVFYIGVELGGDEVKKAS